MATDALLEAYEEVPYPSDPVYQTHPDALATPAFLAGLTPPPVESCRVLEIGCGTAGNLIAMAAVLPGGRFQGVDLSPRQIAVGQEAIDAVGLRNVELRAGDILDMDYGELDYVICHGVFSWCPPRVQDHILSLCAQKLSPHGVAYLSYNLLPGWRRMGVWRDALRWGGRKGPVMRSRVRAGRRFLEVVAQSAADAQYAQLLRDGIEKLKGLPDEYVMHEFMEPFNQPLLFHEMAARAEQHGLQYLGESSRRSGAPPQALSRWAQSRIAAEQTLDMTRNASFRRSLFCRAGLPLAEPTPGPLLDGTLRMNTLCEPVSREPDVSGETSEAFRAEHGQLSTDIPLVKAILVALHRVWPRTVSFAELAADARARLDAVGDPDLTDEIIADACLQCYGSNLLALHLWSPRFASVVPERPATTALARWQAARQMRDVSNLRQRIVPLNAFELAVLALLDGTRDRAALVDELVKAGAAGSFVIEKAGQAVTGADALRAVIAESLEPTLGRLAHGALLVAP
jgi:SAM-dependent methyltransferase